MSKQSDYWLELSDYDFETAKVMQNNSRYLYVGFMCHQSVEKALKAYFAEKTNNTPQKVHDLITLAKRSGILDKLTAQQTAFLTKLSPLNIEARYPSDKHLLMELLTSDRCKNLIDETEAFIKWIKVQL
jgi:HEPN domain-containing protein